MKKHFIIFYIAFIQFAVLPFVKTYKDINKKESLLSKLPETTINNKDDSKINPSKKGINTKKIVLLNNKKSESLYNHTATPSPIKKEEIIPPSLSNATLLNLIIEQTEIMKTEICKSSSDMTKGLEKLNENILNIKKKLKIISSGNMIQKDEIILDFTVCINNLNLIRVELIKMENLIENMKKANCKEINDSKKKYDQAKNTLNKLVEGIQNFLRKTNLDFNLLILT